MLKGFSDEMGGDITEVMGGGVIAKWNVSTDMHNLGNQYFANGMIKSCVGKWSIQSVG